MLCLRCRLRYVSGGKFDSQGGYTALMWAAGNGHADCVRLLIDAGADKEAKDHVRVGRCFVEAPSRLFLFFFSSLFIVRHSSPSASRLSRCLNDSPTIRVYHNLSLNVSLLLLSSLAVTNFLISLQRFCFFQSQEL
jgi:ankyrin repeat protein